MSEPFSKVVKCPQCGEDYTQYEQASFVVGRVCVCYECFTKVLDPERLYSVWDGEPSMHAVACDGDKATITFKRPPDESHAERHRARLDRERGPDRDAYCTVPDRVVVSTEHCQHCRATYGAWYPQGFDTRR